MKTNDKISHLITLYELINKQYKHIQIYPINRYRGHLTLFTFTYYKV